MFSFSVNPTVDMSGINFNAKTDEGRLYLSTVFEHAYFGELQGGNHPVCNVDKYGYGAEKLSKLASSVKEVPLITEDELEAGYKGIVPELAQHEQLIVETDYSAMNYETRQVYEQSLEQFVDMREYIFLEDSIDVVEVLLSAYQLKAAAIEKMKALVAKYANFGNLITVLAEGGNYRGELLRLQCEPICPSAC